MREQLLKIAKNPVSASTIVGVITFGAGASVGYILGRRKRFEIFEPPPRVGLVLDAEDLAELEENDHNLGVVEDNEVEDDDEESEDDNEVEDDDEEVEDRIPSNTSAREFIAEKLKERLPDLVYEDGQDEADFEPVTSNIFAGSNEEWDYEQELANRDPSHPYVIHKDEFWNEEVGYDQSTLTWYAGDEILSDQESQPIYNISDVIGPLLFGHGSGDPNVFHVRNDKTKSEFEIIFDPGYFKVEVLGYEIEDDAAARDMKHSNSPRRFQKTE